MTSKWTIVCPAAGASLLLSASAFAHDATRLASGEAAWDKAGCPQCHGASGEGGSGGESVARPSLRTTRLAKESLIDTIGCGPPGTQIPPSLAAPYSPISCSAAQRPPPAPAPPRPPPPT